MRGKEGSRGRFGAGLGRPGKGIARTARPDKESHTDQKQRGQDGINQQG